MRDINSQMLIIMSELLDIKLQFRVITSELTIRRELTGVLTNHNAESTILSAGVH